MQKYHYSDKREKSDSDVSGQSLSADVLSGFNVLVSWRSLGLINLLDLWTRTSHYS